MQWLTGESSGKEFPLPLRSVTREQLIREVDSLRHRIQGLESLAESFASVRSDDPRAAHGAVIGTLQNHPSVVIAFDVTSMDLVDANGAAEIFYGCTREEILQKRLSDLNTLPEAELRKELGLAFAAERDCFFFTHRISGGETRDVEMRPVTLSATGRDICIAIVTDVTDVTERRFAERELHSRSAEIALRAGGAIPSSRIGVAVHQASDAIILTGQDGVIEYVNPSFERITGWRASEIVGLKPSVLKSGHQETSFYESMWTTLSSSDAWQGEVVNRRRDGSLYIGEMTISPVHDERGQGAGFLAVQRDVTEERRLRHELARTRELEVLGWLVRIFAHEARSPLHTLQILVDVLFMELADEPDKAPVLSTMREQVDRLTRFLHLRFDGTRSEPPRRVESINAAALCHQAVSHWQISNPGSALEPVVEADTELEFEGERGPVLRALGCLIENATQHTPAGGSIVVSARRNLDDVVFAVVDSGTGIPRATLDDVVRPFFSTRKGAVGLGLPIVKHIAESMGGRFKIRNNAPSQRGCTAQFSVPTFTGDDQ